MGKFITIKAPLNGGDAETASDHLIFKIYNNSVLFYTSGKAYNTQNVSIVDNGVNVLITQIPIEYATSYNFQITAIDENGAEGAKSPAKTFTSSSAPQNIISKSEAFLYNFRILNSAKNKIKFNSKSPTTGLTKSIFTLRNETNFVVQKINISINSIVSSADGLTHTLTLSTPVMWWWQMPISYVGGTFGNITFEDEKLSYIDNKIIPPASTGVNHTITTATTVAQRQTIFNGLSTGDVVYIDEGAYTGKLGKITKSGAENNPIRILGRKSGNIISSNYYNYGNNIQDLTVDFDGNTVASHKEVIANPFLANEMPTFTTTSEGNGTGLELDGVNFVIIEGIQIKGFQKQIALTSGASKNIIQNCNVRSTEETSGSNLSDGFGIDATHQLFTAPAGGGADVITEVIAYNQLINCNIIEGGEAVLRWSGDNNVIKNTNMYSRLQTNGEGIGSDYLMLIEDGSNNQIINSKAFRMNSGYYGHTVQHFAFKGTEWNARKTEYNLSQGCENTNMGGSFEIRNKKARFNVHKDFKSIFNVAYAIAHNLSLGWKPSVGMALMSGASNNTHQRGEVFEAYNGIEFIENMEELSLEDTLDNEFIDITMNNIKVEFVRFNHQPSVAGDSLFRQSFKRLIVNGSPYFQNIEDNKNKMKVESTFVDCEMNNVTAKGDNNARITNNFGNTIFNNSFTP